MTRNRWTGLAGVLFAVLFFAISFFGPSTPDANSADAVAKYASYWNNDDHQKKAQLALLLVTYAAVLFVLFCAGLRDRLRAVDSGPLPSYVLAAGTAAAAMLTAGAGAAFCIGIAAADSSGFKVDGNLAIVLDDIGYGLLATALMTAAGMAVATGIISLRTRVLPAWTAWLGFLLGLTAAGSIFTAWLGFIGLPVWVLAVSVVMLLTSVDEPAPAAT